MVNVIKVYLQRPNSQKTEIRRLAVSSDTISKFELLCVKVIELFPVLCGKTFEISWKDSEGDLILMSSDVELAQALANADDGLIKIYVHLNEYKHDDNSHQDPREVPPQIPPMGSAVHKGVICDECNTQIKGHRYKCLECKDYDLCSSCNAADKHPQHDMLRLVLPVDECHSWIYQLFARRMWKTLFGPTSLYFRRTTSPDSECPFASSKPAPANESSPSKGSGLSDGAGPSNGSTPSNEPKWEGFHQEGFPKFDIPDMLGNLDKFMKHAGIEVKIGSGPFGLFNPWASNSGPHPEAPSEKPTEKKNDQAKSPDSGSPSAATNQSQADKTVIPETNGVSSSVNETISSAADGKTGVPEKQEEKEQSLAGNEGDMLSSPPDGWTLLNKDDASRKTPERETTPPAAEKPQEDAKKSQDDKPVNEEKNRSEDPKIANALLKMRAMGFTNEGGWLERLLVTKQGNINEALDALYPNTQRH